MKFKKRHDFRILRFLQLETMMEEVSYKHYAETGRLVEEMTFEDFVKLYVNHRPAFGITKTQIRQAFQVFATPENSTNPTLTTKQFLEILYGRGDKNHVPNSSEEKLCGLHYLGRFFKKSIETNECFYNSANTCR